MIRFGHQPVENWIDVSWGTINLKNGWSVALEHEQPGKGFRHKSSTPCFMARWHLAHGDALGSGEGDGDRGDNYFLLFVVPFSLINRDSVDVASWWKCLGGHEHEDQILAIGRCHHYSRVGFARVLNLSDERISHRGQFQSHLVEFLSIGVHTKFVETTNIAGTDAVILDYSPNESYMLSDGG